MVNIEGVIPLEKAQPLVLNKAMLFPCHWFKMHSTATNLRMTVKLDDLLDSKKFSWRVFGRFAADMDKNNSIDWVYPWYVLSLKDRTMFGIEARPNAGLRFKWDGSEERELPASIYVVNAKGFLACTTRSAIVERDYNDAMLSVFAPKYPIALASKHPVNFKMEPWVILEQLD